MDCGCQGEDITIMKHALSRYMDLIANNNFGNNLEFTIFITNHCNARCRHCFYASEINGNSPELNLESFRVFALNLPKNCHKITFTGGEPFLREDLSEIMDIFIKRGLRKFSIMTNGILTERILRLADRVNKLDGIELEIAVSLDGLKDTHDKIRQYPGAFDSAIETLRGLRERKANVVVLTVTSNLNYDIIEKFDQYIYDSLGLDVYYQFIRGAEISGLPDSLRRSFNPREDNLLPSMEDMDKFFSLVHKVYKTRIGRGGIFLKNVYNFTVLESTYLIYKKNARIFPCIAGKTRLVLYPSGEVALCEYMKPFAEKLQDLNFNIYRLRNSSMFLARQKAVKKCHCNHGCFINIVGTLRFLLLFIKNSWFFYSIDRESRLKKSVR